MASISKGENQQRKQTTSRLQRRAPSSIQVNPASSFAQGWKVAIPLLSPLAMSPTSPPNRDRTAEVSSSSISTEKANLIKSNWQHPSAPFHYDPTNNINKPAKQFVPSFVPRCR
ncbi:hypothetical protein MKX03_009682 [Papaver bracteatum]|nr:hypothetical protein MKX03_009682 [Papaver bracteatum]